MNLPTKSLLIAFVKHFAVTLLMSHLTPVSGRSAAHSRPMSTSPREHTKGHGAAASLTKVRISPRRPKWFSFYDAKIGAE